jgi:hypothetical protein
VPDNLWLKLKLDDSKALGPGFSGLDNWLRYLSALLDHEAGQIVITGFESVRTCFLNRFAAFSGAETGFLSLKAAAFWSKATLNWRQKRGFSFKKHALKMLQQTRRFLADARNDMHG